MADGTTTTLPSPSMATSAGTANILTNDTFSDNAQHQAAAEHGPHSAALISAFVCGGVVLAILSASCWLTRFRIAQWLQNKRAGMHIRSTCTSYKLRSAENTPSSGGSEWTVLREAGPVAAAKPTTTGMVRSASTDWVRHDYREASPATKANALQGPSAHSVRLGVRGFGESERTKSTSHTRGETPAKRTQAESASGWKHQQETPMAVKQLETTLQAYPQRYLNCSLPTISTPGTMPGPVTPATTSHTTARSAQIELETRPLPQQEMKDSTPYRQPKRREQAYTPSCYQPHPSTSLAHPGPSNSTSSNNAKATTAPAPRSTLAFLPNPFINPPILAPPPDTELPPSRAQPYSTVSLGSTAEIYRRIDSNINLYRELSTRVKDGNGIEQANDISGAETGSHATTQMPPAKTNEPIYRGLSSPPRPRRSPSRASRSPGSKSGGEGGGTEGPLWDFLSAEDAVDGRWRNSGGWETIYEEGDEV